MVFFYFTDTMNQRKEPNNSKEKYLHTLSCKLAASIEVVFVWEHTHMCLCVMPVCGRFQIFQMLTVLISSIMFKMLLLFSVRIALNSSLRHPYSQGEHIKPQSIKMWSKVRIFFISVSMCCFHVNKDNLRMFAYMWAMVHRALQDVHILMTDQHERVCPLLLECFPCLPGILFLHLKSHTWAVTSFVRWAPAECKQLSY